MASGKRIMLVIAAVMLTAMLSGCAGGGGYPDLSTFNKISGDAMTQEQTQEEIDKLQKEKATHREKTEEDIKSGQ